MSIHQIWPWTQEKYQVAYCATGQSRIWNLVFVPLASTHSKNRASVKRRGDMDEERLHQCVSWNMWSRLVALPKRCLCATTLLEDRLLKLKTSCRLQFFLCFVLAVQDVSSWLPVPAVMPASCCHASTPLLWTLSYLEWQAKYTLSSLNCIWSWRFITATEQQVKHFSKKKKKGAVDVLLCFLSQRKKYFPGFHSENL